MGSRIAAAAFGLCALAWPAAARSEEPESPPVVVPADRIPVLGTVGDYPPAHERVVAELFAGEPPRLVVEGKQLDLKGFQALLRVRADAAREPDAAKSAQLHLVIRADRAVRWQDAQFVLQAAADPSVGVYKMLFAARPEDGSEEGAMALYLPKALPRESGATPMHGFDVELLGGEPGFDEPELALHARLQRALGPRRIESSVVHLAGSANIATGAVLESVDVLLRSGAKSVLLRGTVRAKEDSWAAGRDVGPATASESPRIRFLGDFVDEAPAGHRMPPIARVRGALAGQTAVVAEPVLVVEDPSFMEGDGEPTPGPAVFSGRRGGHRNLKLGASLETEEAVFRGLEWLKAHQSPNGSWNSDGFEEACGDAKCGGSGGPLYDVGVTGLATLAFLGYGETHKTPRYGQVVRNAMKFLKNMQDAEGCFGARTSPHFTYNHAIATLAMAEAYGLTQSPLFKSSAQNGVNFILQCRNPGLAWRYGVRPQDNDTSITGWMVMALKSAKSAGLDVPDEAFRGAVAWLDKVTDPETGRAGYTALGNGPCRPVELMKQFPSNKSESLTAIAVLSRIFSGAKRDDLMVARGIALCVATLPHYDLQAGTVDHTYWHFGTLAAFQVGGDAWESWHEPMKTALLAGQRKEEGHARGSWDPSDPWGGEGGRIYSTALAVMSLEVYYRYARVFGEPKPK
ncbi:MAG TPA: prenyltransferase/squalene oxidase repeat-containing protein [Planctomycetota bacterium]|nr:prenyltransferase/squalene oxidase repeat-containing protein [Planctomycetota bacterium]